MKKRNFVFYSVAIMTLLLQSCVSNYTVSSQQKINTTETKIANTEILETAENQMPQSICRPNDTAAPKISFMNLTSSAITISLKKANKAQQILNQAYTYLGTPYLFGGMTRRGIDCSAFVLSVFGAAAGRNLPRVASSQSQEGKRVDQDELEKGDLVFFSTMGGRRISHVGIVENVSPDGEIKFIHSSSSKGVAISSLRDTYWHSKYRFARRVIQETL